MTREEFIENLKNEIENEWYFSDFETNLEDYLNNTSVYEILSQDDIYTADEFQELVDDDLKSDGVDSIYFQMENSINSSYPGFIQADGQYSYEMDGDDVVSRLIDDTDIQNAIEEYFEDQADMEEFDEEE